MKLKDSRKDVLGHPADNNYICWQPTNDITMNRTTTFLKCIISLAFSFICGAAYSEDNGSKAICIDKGRQLFVDEYLIEKTDLERIAHRAKKNRKDNGSGNRVRDGKRCIQSGHYT